MEENKTVLWIADLEKKFHIHLLGDFALETIKNFSLHLNEGEFAILVGPNGIGKSTVLNCIFRTYLPTGGKIIYRSRDGSYIDLAKCDERTITRLRKTEMAYVTQFLHCQPRVPAELVVATPRLSQGIPMGQALREARQLMERLGLPPNLWRASPVSFSGGEKQRVNLARAFILQPRLLLMDEPTASLDQYSTGLVVELLAELKERGTTVLSVFHDFAPVKELVTKVIHLDSHFAQEFEPQEALGISGVEDIVSGRCL